MIQLHVTITALSPLCFSERRPGGQFRFSIDYVSGAVLRGAAAALMLRAGEEQTPTFRRLFGVGQAPAALFRCAYPGDAVLPHTAMSCKDYPGFLPSPGAESSEARHGVFDTLIDRLCFEQLQPPGLLYMPRCLEDHCDPGRAEASTGFYQRDATRYQSRSMPQRLLTRVGLNRQRMAAEDALLYSPMVLSEAWWSDQGSEQAHFVGSVWVDDDLAPALRTTLPQITHLGSGAARGLGQVQIACETGPSSYAESARLQARLCAFKTMVRSRWQEIATLCEATVPPCPYIFTINLRSDAILKEYGWLSTTVLTAEMLQVATGVTDPSLCLLRSYSSYDYRGGWHTAQRLPKDTALVTRLGSVFVFQTADLTPWYAPLAALEVSGIGERTAEGFGEVRVCDNFHIVGRTRQ